jgi:uncharacterized membrane protein
MLELLQNFEQAAGRLAPLVLIIPGIIMLLAGLFIWLGGLGLTRLLAAVTGLATGFICGFFFIRRTLASAAFLATVLAAAALIFERIFFIILTTALAAALTFTVFAAPYLGNPKELSAAAPRQVMPQTPALSAAETTEVIKTYVVNLARETKQVRSQMPFYSWIIIPAVAAIALAIGLKSSRFVSALSCAFLGTILIFAAMVLLLLYKGSAPITGIYRKTAFYGGAFALMVTFGAIEQLLLFRREKKLHPKKKKKTIEEIADELEQTKTQSWRGA